MLVELANIAFQKPYERLTFGVNSIEQAEAALPTLPKYGTDAKAERLYQLGKRRLWLGDTTKAIEHLRNAYELVMHDRQKGKGSRWEAIVFELGLAYLRLCENENCVKRNNGQSCLLPIQDAGVRKVGEPPLRNRAANFFFENPGFGNNSLTVKLVGQQSNRSAIDVQLPATISENGQFRTVCRRGTNTIAT